MIDWQNNKETKPEKNKAIIILAFDGLAVETGEITDYGFKIDCISMCARYLDIKDIKFWAYINKPTTKENIE